VCTARLPLPSLPQIANEINARRIYDEYDFFSGILKSQVFIAVIIITCGLQAIIINFLGVFFKVRAHTNPHI
jgi:Ca2+-transporting ATPase